MKILYLAHRIPYPPNKGDKLRSFRQLDRLARDHEVWCACFVDAPDDLSHVAELQRRCAEVAAVRLRPAMATLRGACSLLAGGTLTESYYASRRMRALVADWDEQVRFDVIVAFSSSMAQYALPLQAGRKVLDLCDLDSRKWLDYSGQSSWPMSWAYRTEGRRLARRELQFVNEFDATILITAAEARGLSGWECVGNAACAEGKVYIVGNGVERCAADAPYGARRSADEGARCVPDAPPVPSDRRPIVGFVGAMDYGPNVDAVCWFAEHCWPRIHDAFPQTEFRIVGRSPTRRVRRLRRIPGVVVTGEVADVSAEVRRFTVSVAPLRIARGLQNKVLEAMAHGKPVVLTRGAAQGLSAVNGRDCVVADDAEEFARQVGRLLADPEECQRLGSAALCYVESHHDWDRELDQFEWIVTGVGVTRSAKAQAIREHPERLPVHSSHISRVEHPEAPPAQRV